MSNQYPTWMLLTVPHSGTRYVQETFERSGYPSQFCWSFEEARERSLQCPVQHFNVFILHQQMEFIDKIEQPIIVARDPIKTWGSHWSSMEQEPNQINKVYVESERINRLKSCWGLQHHVWKEYEPYVFRVDKDDVEELGRDIGAYLKADRGAQTHARTYAMKEAIAEKDLHKINKLTNGTKYFQRFREAHTIYGDFYESNGYDLWWV